LRVLDADRNCAPASECRWHTWSFFARRIVMMDIVMLTPAFVFFAVSIAYVYACDRL
jgi:hypothetical protein